MTNTRHYFSLLCLLPLFIDSGVFGQSVPAIQAPPHSSDCSCIVQMVLDFMSRHSWTSVTIVQTDDNGWLSKDCLRGRQVPKGRSLLQELFRRGWSVRILKSKMAENRLSDPDFSADNPFFLTSNNNSTRHLLQLVEDDQFFVSTSWMILTDTTSRNALKSTVSKIEAFIPSAIFVFDYDSCSSSVLSFYRVGPRVTEVQQEEGCVWTVLDGFEGDPYTESFYERRKDFKGYPMKGVGVDVFEFFTTYLPNDGVTGFVGDLVTTLKNTHNFTLTYEILEGYAYGKLIDTEKNIWNGMVGELQSKRADLTVSELSITKERSEVVTYTQPIRVISRKLFVALTENTERKILTYLNPMEPEVYACLFAVMLGMATFMMLMDKAVHKLLPDEYTDPPVPLQTTCWYILSALLQQSCVSYPSSWSPRIVFWFGFIVSLMVYTAYSATLLSHIAVVRPATLPFTNLFELAKLSGWDAGCNRDDLFQVTASQTCASEPRSDECQTLYDVWNNNVMRSDDNLVPNYMAGLKRALEGEYVFIGVGVTTRYYIGKMPVQEACKIRELPGMYIQGGIGIGLQHQSPFQMSFDNSLQKMRENGLMHKLVKMWLSREEICDSSNVISADLIDVSTLFIVFLSGLVLSAIFLMIERYQTNARPIITSGKNEYS